MKGGEPLLTCVKPENYRKGKGQCLIDKHVHTCSNMYVIFYVTNEITPWSRMLFEELVVPQLVQKLIEFYWTLKLITVSPGTCPLTLPGLFQTSPRSSRSCETFRATWISAVMSC